MERWKNEQNPKLEIWWLTYSKWYKLWGGLKQGIINQNWDRFWPLLLTEAASDSVNLELFYFMFLPHALLDFCVSLRIKQLYWDVLEYLCIEIFCLPFLLEHIVLMSIQYPSNLFLLDLVVKALN